MEDHTRKQEASQVGMVPTCNVMSTVTRYSACTKNNFREVLSFPLGAFLLQCTVYLLALCVCCRGRCTAVACMYVVYNEHVSDISWQVADLAAARLLSARNSYCTYPTILLLFFRSVPQALLAILNY